MVNTAADDKRDLLKDKLKDLRTELKDCINLIEEMFDPDTWGSDEFRYDFREKSFTFQDELRKLKREIDNYNK
jgi:hypothetical protein